ncbi:MAG TPA: type II restriction endonuclease [Candidatus Nanoarchaeia archaeon]|nr:type II restriction endonuclease [Candidatus Nanoarchaeia archaeon]
MATPLGERAISEALGLGNAILKFISPNDVGLTGGHQCGYYLPKAVWQMFAAFPPQRGRNDEAEVAIHWHDGRITDSRVKWYGRGTRSEYRLTRFGRDFPFMTPDSVGDLLVLVPVNHREFLGFVLDLEEDIEELQSALGIETISSWAAFQRGAPVTPPEDEASCIDRQFRRFVDTLNGFPSGAAFSEETRRVLASCGGFEQLSADGALLRCMESEYRLFRLAERQLCQNEIIRVFRDVDDFLSTASSIMNRRKSRAGRSLENHVDYLLSRAGIPHDMRPPADGKPDILIPSLAAYRDPAYPPERLIVVGVKTTCKDRWRQVLNEARRIPRKHILTTQQGISGNQLTEMHGSGVTLIVPADIQRQYPRSPIELLTIEAFLTFVRNTLAP